MTVIQENGKTKRKQDRNKTETTSAYIFEIYTRQNKIIRYRLKMSEGITHIRIVDYGCVWVCVHLGVEGDCVYFECASEHT